VRNEEDRLGRRMVLLTQGLEVRDKGHSGFRGQGQG